MISFSLGSYGTCWGHLSKHGQPGELYQNNILLLSMCDKATVGLWEFGPGLNLAPKSHWRAVTGWKFPVTVLAKFT